MTRPHSDTLPDADEVRRRVDETLTRAADGRMELVGRSRGDPVALAEASDEWPLEFARLRRRLTEALGPTAIRIVHIGSTAIPGIRAKPVIDVHVSVQDIRDEQSFVPAIEALGWPLRSREAEFGGHLYFRDPAGTPRRVQVHVSEAGSKWERDHLLFRDYLRAHPEAVREYEDIKRAAAHAYGSDRLAYTEAKGPFIERTLATAEEWAAVTGWRP